MILYTIFQCKEPKESVRSLSDNEYTIIKNRLKMNYSKTEFIVFRTKYKTETYLLRSIIIETNITDD